MKYFVNIDLKGGPSGSGSSGSDGSGPPVGTNRWAQEFPQFERWYIESVNATGTYNLKNKDTSHRMRGVINIHPRPGIAEVGDIANVGFYDCNRRKPYIWSTGRALSGNIPITARFFAWLRFGVKMFHRHSAVDWDDPADEDSFISLTSSSGFTGTGTILRTDAEGIAYWANGNSLHTIDLTSSVTDSTDLGGEITSLCLGEITGRSYCTVSAFVDAGDDECTEGYAAGVAAAEISDAFSAGEFDCTTFFIYDPVQRANDYLAFHPPDEGESEEWQGCYIDGFTIRYTEIYNTGYESEGCTVP